MLIRLGRQKTGKFSLEEDREIVAAIRKDTNTPSKSQILCGCISVSPSFSLLHFTNCHSLYVVNYDFNCLGGKLSANLEISWVAVVAEMKNQRTALDYQRRWINLLGPHIAQNYPEAGDFSRLNSNDNNDATNSKKTDVSAL
jgi:hypothetical protein